MTMQPTTGGPGGWFPVRLQKDSEVSVISEVKLRLGARFLHPRWGVLEVVGIDYDKKRARLKDVTGVDPATLPYLGRRKNDWVMVRDHADLDGRPVWAEHTVTWLDQFGLEWE